MEVGGPCKPKDKESICMDLTQCVSFTDKTHRCECKLGYIEKHKSVQDHKHFPYGLGCDIAFGCGMSGSKNLCDQKSDLICKQGACACLSMFTSNSDVNVPLLLAQHVSRPRNALQMLIAMEEATHTTINGESALELLEHLMRLLRAARFKNLISPNYA
jgi:hypothetical protein